MQGEKRGVRRFGGEFRNRQRARVRTESGQINPLAPFPGVGADVNGLRGLSRREQRVKVNRQQASRRRDMETPIKSNPAAGNKEIV